MPEFKPHILEFARNLKQAGILYAFGVAGGGPSLELITALEAQGIKYYPVAHEAAGAMMSGACCRDGKTRAVAIGIKGPGFANFVPGILSNYYENRPAITISEAYSPSTPMSKKHKRLDHKSVISTIVKEVAAVDGLAETTEKMIEAAQAEVPRPVHFDLYAEPASPQMVKTASLSETASGQRDIDEIIKLVKNSSKPAIVLGSLAARKLRGINWESLNVPVATTAAGKGCVNEYSPFAAGVITGEVQELAPENHALAQADLIIAFGLRNTEVINAKPFATPLIIIDSVHGDLHNGFEAKIECIVSDIEKVAREITAVLVGKSWGEDILQTYKAELVKELLSDPWLPAAVFRKIEEIIPEGILVLDTGLFCTVGETIWRAKSPENFLGSSVGRFMGTSIPTAIGAAIFSPDKRIICVAGDGGIRPYFPEIKLAVREKLPILFVLMSDDAYGTIAFSGRPKGFTSSAYEIKDSSWWKVAEATGCPAVMAQNINEVELALLKRRKSDGPLFLEAHFDSSRYLAMTKKLR